MDQGIRAVWYDLTDDDKIEYLDWLHGTYLPAILQRPGIMWAAHYEITGGGANMDKISDVLERAPEGIGNGADYALLVGAGSPHVFFKPIYEEVDAKSSTTLEMLAKRQGERINVFTEEARVLTRLSHEHLCRCLELGVVVLPGTALGPAGEGFVRISLTAEIPELEEALVRMRRLSL